MEMLKIQSELKPNCRIGSSENSADGDDFGADPNCRIGSSEKRQARGYRQIAPNCRIGSSESTEALPWT